MAPAIIDSKLNLPSQKILSHNDSIKATSTTEVDYTLVGNGIAEVPVTVLRKPYSPRHAAVKGETTLSNPGTPRTNIAASQEAPQGTTQDGWADKHRGQTVLQQHCAYFDPDADGIIWPLDTYRGFRDLGYNILLSLFAMSVINGGLSYPTTSSILPDPFLRIYLAKIHRDKHGSDTGTYDTEGRFIPQKFEDVFSKYSGDGGKTMTLWDVSNMIRGQRCVFDFFGWVAVTLEWLATYILLWPADGKMRKDDIRRVYDGSIFHHIAAKRRESANR